MLALLLVVVVLACLWPGYPTYRTPISVLVTVLLVVLLVSLLAGAPVWPWGFWARPVVVGP